MLRRHTLYPSELRALRNALLSYNYSRILCGGNGRRSAERREISRQNLTCANSANEFARWPETIPGLLRFRVEAPHDCGNAADALPIRIFDIEFRRESLAGLFGGLALRLEFARAALQVAQDFPLAGNQ